MMVRAKMTVLGLGELALAVTLWRRGPVDDPLRWTDPLGWLRATTAENALIEVGRVVVLAVVAWMVLATVVALGARMLDVVFGSTACVAAVSHLVPRFIVAMVVTAIASTAPVLAQTHTPVAPVGPVRDGRAPTTLVTPPPSSSPTPPPVPVPVPVPQAAPRPAASTTTHVVAAGESLWSIARDRVGNDAVVQYWHEVCDANRATVPSGDVNLIHPGETVVLPA
jgi:nucleoid-associated protein YgaU